MGNRILTFFIRRIRDWPLLIVGNLTDVAQISAGAQKKDIPGIQTRHYDQTDGAKLTRLLEILISKAC
ncbi:MAG: hypothetical protein JJV98_17730 [Desulfosarcina sp.]|nr:hypothetical protein [Desulfobacterales bacterium]